MKKRTVSGNETSSKQLRCRQTRSNTNSKQTHAEHDHHGQHKRHKVRLADIQESPVKKSPETNSSHRLDNLKADERFDTPKSNRSSYLHDSTPFKDDFLLASQGYDTQCDVRWDCTSPDALRYIRKNRRRHHSSDVADIVQLLIPEESQKEDAGLSATNTPPLLGLWMNSSNQSKHASKEDKSGCSTLPQHSSKLVRFRKKERARSNANRDVKMPSELLEKLKLAVERCNEGPSEATETTTEIGYKKEGFDQSKDLFASAEAARSDKAPDPLNVKKAEDGDPDVDWSDDDMFQEDSFLIKATQDPGLESKETQLDKRGNKRKSHNVEESQSKISKVCSSTYQREQSKGVIPYKMLKGGKGRSPSPFRKVKSFNDIDQVETKRANDLRPQKGRKCLSLRNVDNLTKAQSVTNPAVRPTDVQCSNASSYQTIRSTDNSAPDKKQLPTQSCPSVEKRTCVDKNSTSIVKKNVSSVPAATQSSVAISGRNSTSTKTGGSALQPGFDEACSSGPNKTVGKGPIVPVCSTSHSIKGQISMSSRTYIVAKPQNTSSCSVDNCQRTVAQSPNPAVDKGMTNKINPGLNCSGSTVSSTSTTTTYRRRSSGMFDTSLSDDLLCQLAEPDEVLESQACPTTDNTLNGKSHGVSTASLGGKPQQGTTKCTSVSCDRPEASKNHPVTESKKVPQNSSISKPTCADGNKARTKQSLVISGSESVRVGKGTNSVINLSQVPSTQKSKFKFKSKSANSEIDVPTPVSSKVSGNLPTSVSAPELNKLHAAAPKPSGASLVDNSEDLFISDEDELSEQQILAMLDTVEMEASQKPPVPEGHHCPDTNPCAFPSKCSLNEIEQKKHAARAKLQQKKPSAVSPETLSLNASQTKLSPSKYTQYEIERKKQAALEKRRVKMKETLSEGSNVIDKHKLGCELDKQQCVRTKNSSTIPCSFSVSPIKYQREDIERKRLAALEKLKQKEETVKNKCASAFSDRNSLSPVKCTQDEIEQKNWQHWKDKNMHQGMLLRFTISQILVPESPVVKVQRVVLLNVHLKKSRKRN